MAGGIVVAGQLHPHTRAAGAPGADVERYDQELAFSAAYHELRAPLSLIATAAHAAATEADPELLHRRCDTIARVAERTLRVARQVIDTVRTDGLSTGETGTYAPLVAVERALGDFRTLGTPIDADLGQQRSLLLAEGDVAHFETLLHVLLGDAIDHGDGTAIVVSARCARGALEVRIANGVAAGDQPGAGLGRLLRERLCARLGATIAGECREGRYHTTLLLPLLGRASRAGRARAGD